MSKRLCSVCRKTPLHHDNKSGICRACKSKASETNLAKAGNRSMPIDPVKVEEAPAPNHNPGPAQAKSNARSKPAKDRALVLERTDKQPKKPFTGLNLLVVEALQALGGVAPVAAIADHMRKRAAFKDSKQEPDKAARWHAWSLRKHGYLRKAKSN
jgi:hypothetical protein